MAVPNPKTWAAGETVDAPEGNAEWRDTLNFLLNPPRALAYRDATIGITNNAFELVAWNNELYDSHGAHSLVTSVSRLIAPEAGLYVINLQATFLANGTGNREASIRKNSADSSTGGTELAKAAFDAVAGGPNQPVQVYVEAQLNATDYIQCFVKQTSGATLDLVAGSGSSFVQFRWTAKTST